LTAGLHPLARESPLKGAMAYSPTLDWLRSRYFIAH
jgi:hypothetical protein